MSEQKNETSPVIGSRLPPVLSMCEIKIKEDNGIQDTLRLTLIRSSYFNLGGKSSTLRLAKT